MNGSLGPVVRTGCVAAFALALLAPREAHADVTSWLAVGSGISLAHRTGTARTSDATDETAVPMSLSLGVGSTPRADFVAGGIFRSVTHFGLGTDLGLALRVATGGFARGQWGAAIDAGIVGRYWNRGEFGRYPFQGVLTLGAPWGLQLAVGAQAGTIDNAPSAQSGFALIEIDLLRLTVMRKGTTTDRIWYNPAPAGGR